MANIAYVDHSYHAKTGSTLFLVEILRQHGHTVDIFWDDSWQGKNGIDINSLLDYDIIIMFQIQCSPTNRYYCKRHNNIISIPMLDGFGLFHGHAYSCLRFWEPLHGCKILSFSSAVHSMATSLGISSLHVRYFPNPEAGLPLPKTEGLHGFFWLRHDSHVSWPTVRTLMGQSSFDSFHLHLAPDPHSPKPSLPTAEECQKFAICTSTWFENKTEFISVLQKANVFFAPRLGEGIGQSFLEAMARGQCVVAPDNGTMNEYIIHGVNGLLYDPHNPQQLDFSRVAELGTNARQTVVHGYDYWKKQEEKLIEYILTPSKYLYTKNTYQHPQLSNISDKITTSPYVPMWSAFKKYISQNKLVKTIWLKIKNSNTALY